MNDTRLCPACGASNQCSLADPRSATLRMAHTLVDALLATAIIVVWQRMYGAEETGLILPLGLWVLSSAFTLAGAAPAAPATEGTAPAAPSATTPAPATND